MTPTEAMLVKTVLSVSGWSHSYRLSYNDCLERIPLSELFNAVMCTGITFVHSQQHSHRHHLQVQESQNLHLTNANFDQLRYIPNVKLHSLNHFWSKGHVQMVQQRVPLVSILYEENNNTKNKNTDLQQL